MWLLIIIISLTIKMLKPWNFTFLLAPSLNRLLWTLLNSAKHKFERKTTFLHWSDSSYESTLRNGTILLTCIHTSSEKLTSLQGGVPVKLCQSWQSWNIFEKNKKILERLFKLIIRALILPSSWRNLCFSWCFIFKFRNKIKKTAKRFYQNPTLLQIGI